MTTQSRKPPGNRVVRTPEVQRERDRTIPRPPPELGLLVVGKADWEPVWHEVRAKPPVKVVGFALLKFADFWDGADIRPGVDLLAERTEQSDKTVRNALAQIRQWGLIWRYREGSKYGRQQLADECRLTIPGDLVTRVPLLTKVATLPDHRNDVPVINPRSPESGSADRHGSPERRSLIVADHRNLTPGSPEPHATDHRNDVPPTYIKDLFTTSSSQSTTSSPGFLAATTYVEGAAAEAGDDGQTGGAEDFEDHRRREQDRLMAWIREHESA